MLLGCFEAGQSDAFETLPFCYMYAIITGNVYNIYLSTERTMSQLDFTSKQRAHFFSVNTSKKVVFKIWAQVMLLIHKSKMCVKFQNKIVWGKALFTLVKH